MAEENNSPKQDDIDNARTAFFNTLGNAHPLVIAPLTNPVFQGGPNWPTRPSWKWIDLEQGEGGVIWATNGLADPWSTPEMLGETPDDFNMDTGLGVEVLLGSKDLDKADLREAIISVSYGLAGNPFLLTMLKALNNQNEEMLGAFNFNNTECFLP